MKRKLIFASILCGIVLVSSGALRAMEKDDKEQEKAPEEIKNTIEQRTGGASSFISQTRDLTDAEYSYEDNEIDRLLRYYLEAGDGEFQAQVLAAASPLIQGSMQEGAKETFADQLTWAFTADVTVIPVNITRASVGGYGNSGTRGGIHWIGLVIRRGDDGGYVVEYLDSSVAPDKDMDLKELLDDGHYAAHKDIDAIIADFAHARGIQITSRVLHTRQQAGDVDCGVWLVDNLVNRARNRPVRNNTETSGQKLRNEHAQVMNNGSSSGQIKSEENKGEPNEVTVATKTPAGDVIANNGGNLPQGVQATDDSSLISTSQIRDLTDAEYSYEDYDIDRLLRYYLEESDGEFQAQVLAAASPLIQGSMQEQARNTFVDQLIWAFTAAVPTVIPVNKTREIVDYGNRPTGYYWIGLVIRRGDDGGYVVEYLDSWRVPDEDTDLKALLDDELYTTLKDIDAIIADVACIQGIQITSRLLHTHQPAFADCGAWLLHTQQQQAWYADCGAWLVDNLVNRARDLPVRNNTEISAQELRKEHARIINSVSPNEIPAAVKKPADDCFILGRNGMFTEEKEKGFAESETYGDCGLVPNEHAQVMNSGSSSVFGDTLSQENSAREKDKKQQNAASKEGATGKKTLASKQISADIVAETLFQSLVNDIGARLSRSKYALLRLVVTNIVYQMVRLTSAGICSKEGAKMLKDAFWSKMIYPYMLKGAKVIVDDVRICYLPAPAGRIAPFHLSDIRVLFNILWSSELFWKLTFWK